MSQTGQQSKDLIRTRVLSRMKGIKSFPHFVVETLNKLKDPDSSAEDVARSLSQDEGLVLRTLRLANSTAMGLPRKVTNISEAIALLGYNNIGNIVMAASVYSVMDREFAGYALGRGELWRHSLAVAQASKYIAKTTRKANEEDAYLCGLLHDIGKIVLNDYVRFGYGVILKLVEEKRIPFPEAETQVLGFDHATVGAILLEQWGLPECFQHVTEFHHTPNDLGPEMSGSQTLLDITYLANTICLMLGIGIGADGLQQTLFPEPITRLGITDGDSLLASVMETVSMALEEISTLPDHP